jgi:choline dehydrogenase-like flavoprotein
MWFSESSYSRLIRFQDRGCCGSSRLCSQFATHSMRSRWSCTICRNTKTAWSSTIRSRMHGACPSHALQIRSTRMTSRWDAGLSIITARFLTPLARKVYRVYIERITGNCSHQHGTTRMADDPQSSVLNKWCQAHEVDNLFVVDGGPFPTATGANPHLQSWPTPAKGMDDVVRR